MVLTAKDASGPLGGPIRVPLHLEGPGIYGHREILVHEGTVGGRGTFDTWTVAPADGVVDPSPWWEDQMHPPKSRNVMLTPEKPVDIEVRLDTAVRFPKPGRYAVQLTTVRGKDMLDDNYPPSGPIWIVLKDLECAIQSAKDLDVPVPLGGLLEHLYMVQRSKGRQNEDGSSIFRIYKELANLA